VNATDIRELRQSLNLNQVEFSQLAGVHPITVSKWERNQTKPTAYQNSLFEEFRNGARNRSVREKLKVILITAGVVLALALLLKHLMKKK
jgi:DNA-binding XRE family transcriptional regulator